MAPSFQNFIQKWVLFIKLSKSLRIEHLLFKIPDKFLQSQAFSIRGSINQFSRWIFPITCLSLKATSNSKTLEQIEKAIATSIDYNKKFGVYFNQLHKVNQPTQTLHFKLPIAIGNFRDWFSCITDISRIYFVRKPLFPVVCYRIIWQNHYRNYIVLEHEKFRNILTKRRNRYWIDYRLNYRILNCFN